MSEGFDLGQILLVGESNPLSERPEHALFPAPDGCSGHRLMRILGVDAASYLRMGRRNLCVGRWAMKRARAEAVAIQRAPITPATPWKVIVMLGAKVAEAFGYRRGFFTRDVYPPLDSSARHFRYRVSLPHPSGLCRLWHEPNAYERARGLLGELLPGIPWGTTETALRTLLH